MPPAVGQPPRQSGHPLGEPDIEIQEHSNEEFSQDLGGGYLPGRYRDGRQRRTTGTAERPRYDGPKAGKDRLDNCWMLGKNCGQEAADKYCQIQGYQRATRFQLENASPTQTLVGQRCTGSHCIAFKSITCSTNARKRGQGEAWPQLMN